jgi:hypothetical protein
MGREVRKVREDWVHPKNSKGKYIPLENNYKEARRQFDEYRAKHGTDAAFEEFGNPPSMYHYMPNWDESEKTHYMMYENTSEGTPISPAFKTPEELAKWLADTGASSFGNMTATYEGWLRVAKGGYAVGAIISNGEFKNGVDALVDNG